MAGQRLVRNGRSSGANIKVGSNTSIIQCPSCQTKFAVRTAQIEEVKNPRFHCSRCDPLFTLEEVLVASTPAPLRKTAAFRPESFIPPAPPTPSGPHLAPPAPEFPHYSQSDPLQPDDAFVEEEEEDYDQEEAAEGAYEDPADEAGKEDYRFEADEEGKKIEEEDRTFEPWRFEAPATEQTRPEKQPNYEKEQIAFPFEDSEEEIPFLDSDEDDEEEEYMGSPVSWMDKVLPLEKKARPEPVQQPDEDEDWLSGLQGKRNDHELSPQESPRIFRKGPEYAEASPLPPSIQPQHADMEATRRPTERRPLFREVSSSPQHDYRAAVQTSLTDAPVEETTVRKWKTVLFIITPLLAGLIGLGVLSFRALSNPDIIQDVFSGTLPAGPAVPPPGLFIADVQFKNISLEGGVEIPALTGKVVNSTNQTFREVTVIGGLFDRNGSPLVEVKSNLSSPLHKSRIKSLSAEMLQRLMTEGSSSAFKVKPGEEAKFVLPFTETNTGGSKITKTPAHFAAKVFSARE